MQDSRGALVNTKEFLGLKGTHNPHRWVMPVVDKVRAGGGSLFGGAALAAGMIAMEETAGRPTIFTTNYRLAHRDRGEAAGRATRGEGPNLLSSRISAALVSRLYEMAQPLELDGPDYRHTVMMHQHRIGG